ncbi:MAG: ATP phosphoribosyltransferase regulatory subunit, partial [Ruminococcus sp.]|nr:ATP phosphoribosyltransferase regulatory subunit [Candidatus Copronaster equi]
YEKFGYTPYKMTKFEEYDLYVKNKNFLISDNIITFTDTSGKLMALKPDVTLSIIKNNRYNTNQLQKVYYNENVYRVPKGTNSFKEILQIGIECLGQVDNYCLGEILSLAVKSLEKISEKSILTVSDIEIISDLLDNCGITPDIKAEIFKLISEKNLHELNVLCKENNVQAETFEVLKQLILLHGKPDDIFKKLNELIPDNSEVNNFSQIINSLPANIREKIEIDFSITGDTKYYNGITFKGFIDNIPESVLSGGQYDRMMKKMKQNSKAVGFAIYLDMLERLSESYNEYDVDTVIIYDENADLSKLNKAVDKISQSSSVLALKEIPEKLKFRQLIKFNGEEAELYD